MNVCVSIFLEAIFCKINHLSWTNIEKQNFQAHLLQENDNICIILNYDDDDDDLFFTPIIKVNERAWNITGLY